MNYSKIGTQLKLARERKGLSHYQVFEVTRIQPSILKEIEEGSTDMAPVFVRSFIKIYCQFLGLDFEKLEEEARDRNLTENENIINVHKNLKFAKTAEIGVKNKLKYFIPIAVFVVVFQLLFFLDLPAKIFNKFSQEDNNRNEEVLEDSLVENEGAEEGLEQLEPEDVERDQSLASQSLFEKIKHSVFKQEVLIQSSNQLKVYFKTDNRSTINKVLSPFTWYYIKARDSLYLRFDDKPGDVQVFYNGEQLDLGSNRFFERKFE